MGDDATTAQDPLYPAAFRLARFYAILSPRVVAQELGVARDRAEALLCELERQGAVGPALIKGTGARESRVNVVEDRPAGGNLVYTASDRQLGRRVLVLAGATALAGLAMVAALTWVGVGVAVARYFHVGTGSPILAALITATLPLLGLLAGWLIEMPLRRAEDLAPYWALRSRSAIWSGATLIAVGATFVRLLS